MKPTCLLPAAVAVAAAITIPAAAQDKEKESPAAQESAAAESQSLRIGEFTFSYDSPWKEKEKTRPMSQGGLTYTPDREDAVPVEADFYHFGSGQGGSVDANIERWKGQFEGTPDAKTEELDFNGRKAHLVKLTGTFMDGPMFGEKKARPDYTLLGAILPSDQGAVFIKMTGPQDAVADSEKPLRALIASAYK